jgi:aminoglycoside phosphotransferase (APT) family kinase protein
VGYEAGRYLAHIHQIPLTEFGSLFAASSADRTSERAYVLAAISQLAEACTGRQLAPAEVVEQFRRLVGCDGCLDRQQPCLLHGDYTPENIIVERGSTGYHVTGLLEFEQALGAGPERDIATLLNWGMEEWPTFQRGFLDGYAESGAVVPRFWPRLRLYQALVSVEHLVALGTASPETIAECRRRIAEALAL